MIGATGRDVVLDAVDRVLVRDDPHVHVQVRIVLVGHFHRHAVTDDHRIGDIVHTHPGMSGVAKSADVAHLVGPGGQFESVAFQLNDQTVGVRLDRVERPGRPGSSHARSAAGAAGLTVGQHRHLQGKAVDVLSQLVDEDRAGLGIVAHLFLRRRIRWASSRLLAMPRRLPAGP